MKALQKTSACLLVVGLIALIPVVLVLAHAELVKSSPAAGAALAHSPTVIQAWFGEELAKSSVMRLYDARNKLLATGGLDPKVSNHRVLKIIPPRLSSGSYLVRWRAVAADDNAVTQNSFRFSIRGAAVSSSSNMAMSLPALQIVAPANHARLTNPVALVIETPGDLKALTMGGMATMGNMSTANGMAPGVHLHVVTDGAAAMPGFDKFTNVGDNRFKYMLQRLSAGTHTVKVYWADNKTHSPQGSVHTVTFMIAQ